MVGDITIYIWLAVGAFATTIISSIASNIILPEKTGAQDGKAGVYLKLWFFLLFLVIGFSIVPIAVKFFTERLLVVVTGSDIPKIIHENGMTIVYVFWFVYIAGLLIALPSMAKDGFFDEEKPKT
jgi:hypothetical protein